MKRVIDYLMDADKIKLAGEFAESDELAILLDVSKEQITELLEEMCKIKCDLKPSSHGIFTYKVHFPKATIEYRFDAMSISALETDEVVIHSFHELTTKTLLESVVSSDIDCPELVELLLLNVLHTEFMINHIDRLFEMCKTNFTTRYHKNMELARKENETYEEPALKKLNHCCYLKSLVSLCDEIIAITKETILNTND